MPGRRLRHNLELLVSALATEARHGDDLAREIVRLQTELRAAQTERLANVARAQSGALPAARGLSGERAAVVAWDMGHNPVGRAYVLHQLLAPDWRPVTIGPSWERYGNGLWPPLREAGMETRVFACRSLLDFYANAALETAKEKFDLVYVSKPRLPSLYLGLLIKENSGCPLLLDIDDHELSFFSNQLQADMEELRQAGAAALIEPYGEIATRFCEKLVQSADAVTVSNVSLRDRFGGVIVRHARDEAAFDPARFDRAAVRRELNIADSDFALIFVGTVRAHKGVLDVLQAIDELADPHISLHIVGDGAPAELGKILQRFRNARVVQHPSWSFENLPWLLMAADCIPLVQDPDHLIARYQIPSKISDASAMGVPALVTDVPPLRDLQDLPGLCVTRRETLKEKLRELKAAKDRVDQRAIRAGFLSEFSNGVNRARLGLAISEIRDIKPLPQEFYDLRVLMSSTLASAVNKEERSRPISAGLPARRDRVDIAFFWKQNDTGLYGRRSDMIAKHLLMSGEIGRILFFDAPLSAGTLNSWAAKAQRSILGHAGLVLRNTIARWERSFDDDRFLQRSFIHRTDRMTRLLGRDLPELSEFPSFVKQEMRDAGFVPENTIAWVCPVVWAFPQISEEIPFRARVVDIIDDQRSWGIDEGYRKQLDDLYRQTLSIADVALSNCAPVVARFQPYAGKTPIHIVPNGAERFDTVAVDSSVVATGAPERRPTIGYVGNMRDRIDWRLLHDVVRMRPNWSFVFAGAADDNPEVESLARSENVSFVGVVEYSELPSFLRSIDVAIVPHVLSGLTDSMNPLKVYNYLAAGVPIISTPVPNLDELAEFIHIAGDREAFVAAIERCLENPHAGDDERRRACLERISWSARASKILELLRPHLSRGAG